MGADSFLAAVAAAGWLGRRLAASEIEKLETYHTFLGTEAAVAGGIGPSETARLWDRHIADSILFGLALETTEDCLDIGSGVGLPGIPLAVLWPEVAFVLLDRSGRRCDLMRRAIGLLRLGNCVVRQQDIGQTSGTFGAIVSRAAIPPQKMMIHVKHHLEPGGVAVLGLSRSDLAENPVKNVPEFDTSVVTVPADILDTDVNLLRIVAT